MLGAKEISRRLSRKASAEDSLLIVPRPETTGTTTGKTSSIDLRLGRWFLGFQHNRTKVIDLSEERAAGEFEASEGKSVYVPFGRTFVVHPGRFVLASTLEWIRLPEKIGGYITGRSSVGRRGLVIETAAGLHPCFSGCITLELSNCGEVPIQLSPGMRICQVFFHELTEPSAENVTAFGGRRRPTLGDYRLDELVKRSLEQNPEQLSLLSR